MDKHLLKARNFGGPSRLFRQNLVNFGLQKTVFNLIMALGVDFEASRRSPGTTLGECADCCFNFSPGFFSVSLPLLWTRRTLELHPPPIYHQNLGIARKLPRKVQKISFLSDGKRCKENQNSRAESHESSFYVSWDTSLQSFSHHLPTFNKKTF